MPMREISLSLPMAMAAPPPARGGGLGSGGRGGPDGRSSNHPPGPSAPASMPLPLPMDPGRRGRARRRRASAAGAAISALSARPRTPPIGPPLHPSARVVRASHSHPPCTAHASPPPQWRGKVLARPHGPPAGFRPRWGTLPSRGWRALGPVAANPKQTRNVPANTSHVISCDVTVATLAPCSSSGRTRRRRTRLEGGHERASVYVAACSVTVSFHCIRALRSFCSIQNLPISPGDPRHSRHGGAVAGGAIAGGALPLRTLAQRQRTRPFVFCGRRRRRRGRGGRRRSGRGGRRRRGRHTRPTDAAAFGLVVFNTPAGVSLSADAALAERRRPPTAERLPAYAANRRPQPPISLA